MKTKCTADAIRCIRCYGYWRKYGGKECRASLSEREGVAGHQAGLLESSLWVTEVSGSRKFRCRDKRRRGRCFDLSAPVMERSDQAPSVNETRGVIRHGMSRAGLEEA